MDIKRVACLYRVSTKAQVNRETDDIPMQQNACADFISTMPGWALEREYSEKGISGYKKSVNDRDVLQQLKRDAESRLFDVLLVFMFDRLGRREDEAPFVVEWFVSQGIEVWSVKEGQQRFDSRVDKLLNYIRFWQSGGESEKTGIRVYEKHTQMIKAGEFCGGAAPYGYKLIPSDRISNKGRQLKDIVIDEKESEVVRLVFRLVTESGWGGYRIAGYLNEKGISTRKNSKWGLSAVNYMIRNPIYKGCPAYGKTSAKSGANKRLNPSVWLTPDQKVERLAIIDEAEWEKAQIIRRARTPDRFKTENINYSGYPIQTKGALLLTGKIRCGHCGSTMCAYTCVTAWQTKKGERKSIKPSYRCTSVNRGIGCSGQKTYTRERIEGPVLEEIYAYLDSLEQINLSAEIEAIRFRTLLDDEKALKAVRRDIKRAGEEYSALNTEIAKAIGGASAFTPEQLSAAISQKERELKELEQTNQERLNIVEHKRQEVNKFVSMKKMVPSWRDEFANAISEKKKMLICEIIESVIVYRDRVEINFKIKFEDFSVRGGMV